MTAYAGRNEPAAEQLQQIGPATGVEMSEHPEGRPPADPTRSTIERARGHDGDTLEETRTGQPGHQRRPHRGRRLHGHDARVREDLGDRLRRPPGSGSQVDERPRRGIAAPEQNPQGRIDHGRVARGQHIMELSRNTVPIGHVPILLQMIVAIEAIVASCQCSCTWSPC